MATEPSLSGTKQTSQSKGAESVTVKLSEVATTYINALQRLFDYSTMILGSTRLINESAYDEFSKGMGVMPANKSRLGYDKAKEETERWILKHIVSEGLGACILALSDCRTICALSEWKAKKMKDQEEVKNILGPEKQDFDLSSMEDKFKHMEEKYGITSQFRDHMERFFKLRQVLVSRGGKVTEEDVTEDGALVLKLKMVQLQTSPLDSADLSSMKVSTQLNDVECRFEVGEKINLNKNEHVSFIVTLAFFITNLMDGVQKFGKAKGMPEDKS